MTLGLLTWGCVSLRILQDHGPILAELMNLLATRGEGVGGGGVPPIHFCKKKTEKKNKNPLFHVRDVLNPGLPVVRAQTLHGKLTQNVGARCTWSLRDPFKMGS